MEKLERADYDTFELDDLSATEGEKYFSTFDEGTYLCAHCGHPLFSSKDKFASTKGKRPAFRAALSNAVKILDDYSLGMLQHRVQCAHCALLIGFRCEDGVASGDTSPQAKFRTSAYSVCLHHTTDVVEAPVAHTTKKQETEKPEEDDDIKKIKKESKLVTTTDSPTVPFALALLILLSPFALYLSPRTLR
eukprot:TRINITY_DN105_c0_g1_i1.p1 TRINITY_DN105_c0_g1~~TRINITY_DN105_c0_g1_i1.p1  ORF type:complete len:191 (-),score=29.56 TRINITY_DN105_c0_g1_i1:19-591(-)